MMLDLALGLNALIWFAALIFPAYGFAKGYYDQRDVLMRAQLILLSLLALLLATAEVLKLMGAPEQAGDLDQLLKYRFWAIGGLAVASALGWAAFALGRARGRRKRGGA